MKIEQRTRHTVQLGTVTTFAPGFEGDNPTGNFVITVTKTRVKVELCYLDHPSEVDHFKAGMDQAMNRFKELRNE